MHTFDEIVTRVAIKSAVNKRETLRAALFNLVAVPATYDNPLARLPDPVQSAIETIAIYMEPVYKEQEEKRLVSNVIKLVTGED